MSRTPARTPARRPSGLTGLLARTVVAVMVATGLGLIVFSGLIGSRLDDIGTEDRARRDVAALTPAPAAQHKALARAYPAGLDVDAHLATLTTLAGHHHLTVTTAEVAEGGTLTRTTALGPWKAHQSTYTLTVTGAVSDLTALIGELDRTVPVTALTALRTEGTSATLTLATYTPLTARVAPAPTTKDTQ